MTAKQILYALKLDPEKFVLSITINEAVDRLIEFIKEWELPIKIWDINKKDVESMSNAKSFLFRPVVLWFPKQTR